MESGTGRYTYGSSVLLSPDGENGFPETLKVTLVYSLGEDENALDLTYEATTDAPTVLNLSHHSF